MRTYCGSLASYIAEPVRLHAQHVAFDLWDMDASNIPPITGNTEPAFPACGECDSCLAGGNEWECTENGNVADNPLEIRIRYKPYNSIYGVIFNDDIEGAVIWEYDEKKWTEGLAKIRAERANSEN